MVVPKPYAWLTRETSGRAFLLSWTSSPLVSTALSFWGRDWKHKSKEVEKTSTHRMCCPNCILLSFRIFWQKNHQNDACRSCLTCVTLILYIHGRFCLSNTNAPKKRILIKIKKCLEWQGGPGICSSQPSEYTLCSSPH